MVNTLILNKRTKIDAQREKGGLRVHQKSIHQSNHTVNNAHRKRKGRLLMIKQGQTIFLLNNYFSRRENLTWKTFLVELSRSRVKGAQLVTNLVTFAWAPFHLIKTSGLRFWQLRCSTEWNSIFAIYTQIFENYHREVFFPHSTLLPNVKNKIACRYHIGEDSIVSMASNQSAFSFATLIKLYYKA